ncbi:MAG: hypothetical protein SNH79_07605 [Rikenellaceae bacterium]
MQKITKVIGLLFIISLILLMIIPIGNTTSLINNTFTVGLRGDYLLHALIYLPWMFVGKLLFGVKLNKYIWFAVGLVTVLALEYIQMLLPYRGFNVNDIIAGLIGVVLSLIISSVVSSIIKSKKYKN